MSKPIKKPICVSLKVDTAERLTLVANYRKGAKSALVEEALERYLDPERRRLLDDAAFRRLVTMSKTLSNVERDVAITTETLSLFVRYFLTINPPLPQAEQDAARALGRQRFQVFVAQIGRRLAGNRRLVSEILEVIATENPDLFSTPDDTEPGTSRPTPTAPPANTQPTHVINGAVPLEAKGDDHA